MRVTIELRPRFGPAWRREIEIASRDLLDRTDSGVMRTLLRQKLDELLDQIERAA